MIQVNVKKDQNGYQEIKISGHSEYEVRGKDIVCASVSSIFITTTNALIRYQNNAIEVKQEDTDTIHVQMNLLKHDQVIDLLVENMLALLEELASQYPKNIKIRK